MVVLAVRSTGSGIEHVEAFDCYCERALATRTAFCLRNMRRSLGESQNGSSGKTRLIYLSQFTETRERTNLGIGLLSLENFVSTGSSYIMKDHKKEYKSDDKNLFLQWSYSRFCEGSQSH